MAELVSEIKLRHREAEQLFAGIAFREPARAIEYCGYLDPSIFTDERISHFWEVLKTTGDSAQAAMDADIYLEITGWMQEDIFVHNFDPRVYANDLLQERVFFNNAAKLSDLVKSIMDHRFEDMRRITSEMASELPVIDEGIPTAIEVGLDFVGSLNDDTVTIPTFIPKIDSALGGLWRKNEVVICSRPSVGKTALGWQIIRNVVQSGKRGYMVSAEMNKRALWARAVCGALRIPYRDVAANRVTQAQLALIHDKNEELMNAYKDRLYIDDRTGVTTADIWRRTANIKPDVIVVDHIRLMADHTKGENEVKRLGRITWNLKQIAKEFDCCVIALAQLNRGLESREDKHPTLADLRDSGEIEENADFVLGLHRARRYLEHQMEKSPADVNVLKFRDGPADLLIKLEFDGMAQWFSDK